MRTHIGYYLKGFNKEYKNEFMKITTKDDFINLIEKLKKTL